MRPHQFVRRAKGYCCVHCDGPYAKWKKKHKRKMKRADKIAAKRDMERDRELD